MVWYTLRPEISRYSEISGQDGCSAGGELFAWRIKTPDSVNECDTATQCTSVAGLVVFPPVSETYS